MSDKAGHIARFVFAIKVNESETGCRNLKVMAITGFNYRVGSELNSAKPL